MLGIRKFSPMVRALGTVGAVAAVVGGITYAQITSNTVSLTDNTLTAATASLAIGHAADCSDGNSTGVSGMNFTDLVPGTESSPFNFCVQNTGNTPLSLSFIRPTDVSASTLNPNDVTLHFLCGVGGSGTGAVDVSTTVGGLSVAQAFGANPLNDVTNDVLTCSVTAKITGGTSPASGASIVPFSIAFSGTAGA